MRKPDSPRSRRPGEPFGVDPGSGERGCLRARARSWSSTTRSTRRVFVRKTPHLEPGNLPLGAGRAAGLGLRRAPSGWSCGRWDGARWRFLKTDRSVPWPCTPSTLDDDGRLLSVMEQQGYAGLVIEAMGGGHVPSVMVGVLEDLAGKIAGRARLAHRAAARSLHSTYGFSRLGDRPAGARSHQRRFSSTG